jgi:putative addiction module component (TIGR02574 family)
MHGTIDVIHEAESLPVEKRTFIVDSLLRSLNPPDSDIDKKWANVAKRRLEELRSGQVNSISADDVFAKIKRRFAL